MKRHPFDLVSFVLGIFVAGIGLRFAIGDGGESHWVFPAVLIELGATFVAIATQRAMRS